MELDVICGGVILHGICLVSFVTIYTMRDQVENSFFYGTLVLVYVDRISFTLKKYTITTGHL